MSTEDMLDNITFTLTLDNSKIKVKKLNNALPQGSVPSSMPFKLHIGKTLITASRKF